MKEMTVFKMTANKMLVPFHQIPQFA